MLKPADPKIMAPTDTSERLRTANALLESYSALSAEAILQHLAPDFTHTVLPESLQMPVRSKDEFAVHAQRITSIFSEFQMIPQAIFEDEGRNSVVVYAKMVGELNLNLGHWENECIIMLKMSEDGTKVVEHKEFVDSAKAKLLQEKIGAAMKGGNVLKD
ncbi:cytochrome p450 protein [Rutstroemia sp. NJR-2017a BVV2]|nr:cytochrome p450 protein [Rutstroemia sp. NJR-2017a BVV2]